jgi:hypothetical protein
MQDDTERFSGRTLEETAALFDGESEPQNLRQDAGTAAVTTSRGVGALSKEVGDRLDLTSMGKAHRKFNLPRFYKAKGRKSPNSDPSVDKGVGPAPPSRIAVLHWKHCRDPEA